MSDRVGAYAATKSRVTKTDAFRYVKLVDLPSCHSLPCGIDSAGFYLRSFSRLYFSLQRASYSRDSDGW